MTDEELIEQHLKEKGATQGPTRWATGARRIRIIEDVESYGKPYEAAPGGKMIFNPSKFFDGQTLTEKKGHQNTMIARGTAKVDDYMKLSSQKNIGHRKRKPTE